MSYPETIIRATAEDQEWLDAFIAATDPEYKDTTDSPRDVSLDALVRRGMRSLDRLQQRTRAQVLESIEGDTRELADPHVVLPEEPILQKDFLAIAERQERLAGLRANGDAQATAEYEHECLDAIFNAVSLGYKSLSGEIPSDNRSIPELIEQNTRGCGGIFIQAAHWIQELGITAFGVRCNESIVGGEDHRTFIVRDAAGKYFLFDPALYIPLLPIPEDFFEQPLHLDETAVAMLDAKDESRAYREKIHPHMVVESIQRQIRSLLLEAVLKSIQPTSQKRLLERWKEFDEESVSHGARNIEMSMLIHEGKLQEARQLALKLYGPNRNNPVTLRYLAEVFLSCDDIENFEKVFVDLSRKLMAILEHLAESIEHRLQTDCAEGQRITPITLRKERQLETCMADLDLLALCAWYIREKVKDSTKRQLYLTLLDTVGAQIFEMSLSFLTLYRKFLYSRGAPKEEEDWEKLCGKITALYIRLCHLIFQE